MQKRIEKGIYQEGEYSFRVRMMISGSKVDKTFDTLPEARIFRDRLKGTSINSEIHSPPTVRVN